MVFGRFSRKKVKEKESSGGEKRKDAENGDNHQAHQLDTASDSSSGPGNISPALTDNSCSSPGDVAVDVASSHGEATLEEDLMTYSVSESAPEERSTPDVHLPVVTKPSPRREPVVVRRGSSSTKSITTNKPPQAPKRGKSSASIKANAKENILVSVRVRPLSKVEKEAGQYEVWRATRNSISQSKGSEFVLHRPIKQRKKSAIRTYTFDRVFGAGENNKTVYEEAARNIVQSSLEGINGAILAYGQTSSGKTHTIMGEDVPFEAGVLRMTAEDIFATIDEMQGREFLLRMSFFEIYKEEVLDLLGPPGGIGKKLSVRQAEDGTVQMDGLTEEIVQDYDQVMELVKAGQERRHVDATQLNERSSRSHTIFRMIIESQETEEDDHEASIAASPLGDRDGAVRVSSLYIVDLAGSERASKAKTSGNALSVGASINLSLSVLMRVISLLAEGKGGQYIPYRDSNLTRILQPALGGNSRTAIVCAITPANFHDNETHSTLRFAWEAKKIQTSAHVNEVMDDGALIKKYKKELVDLRAQLARAQSGQVEVENLQSQHQKVIEEKQKLELQVQREKESKADLEKRLQNLKRLITVPTPRGTPSPHGRRQRCFTESSAHSSPRGPSPHAMDGQQLSDVPLLDDAPQGRRKTMGVNEDLTALLAAAAGFSGPSLADGSNWKSPDRCNNVINLPAVSSKMIGSAARSHENREPDSDDEDDDLYDGGVMEETPRLTRSDSINRYIEETKDPEKKELWMKFQKIQSYRDEQLVDPNRKKLWRAELKMLRHRIEGETRRGLELERQNMKLKKELNSAHVGLHSDTGDSVDRSHVELQNKVDKMTVAYETEKQQRKALEAAQKKMAKQLSDLKTSLSVTKNENARLKRERITGVPPKKPPVKSRSKSLYPPKPPTSASPSPPGSKQRRATGVARKSSSSTVSASDGAGSRSSDEEVRETNTVRDLQSQLESQAEILHAKEKEFENERLENDALHEALEAMTDIRAKLEDDLRDLMGLFEAERAAGVVFERRANNLQLSVAEMQNLLVDLKKKNQMEGPVNSVRAGLDAMGRLKGLDLATLPTLSESALDTIGIVLSKLEGQTKIDDEIDWKKDSTGKNTQNKR